MKDHKKPSIKGILLFLFVSLVLSSIIFAYGDRLSKKHQTNFYNNSIDSEIIKVTGSGLGTTIRLKDGSKVSFSPKYNKALDCSFSTCVFKGDYAKKDAQSDVIYIFRKHLKDTIRFESIFKK